MKATLTAVIAAIEAAALALAVFVAIAIPGILLWWLAFDLSGEPSQVVAGVAGVWMLAHLVPLTFSLTPESALAFGLEPQELSFVISLAPLMLTLLTATLACRSGWRFGGRGAVGIAAPLGGAVGFAGAASAVAWLASPVLASPAWAAILLPAVWFGGWSVVGFVARSAASGHDWWRSTVRAAQRQLEPLSALGAAAMPARSREVVRLAAASFLALLGLGAFGVVAAIVVGYVEIVTLSQGLQLDLLANLLVFFVQLAVLPVAWAWAVAWFTGAGFAIGAGSSVTPFETLLGPLPSLPLLGAIPQGWGAAGALAPALVVLAGVMVGVLAGGSRDFRRVPLISAILVPVLAAACAGLAVAGLSALASGAVGPGRLAEVGPGPWLTGGLAAAELGVGMLCGVFARRVDHARLLEAVPGFRLGERGSPAQAENAQLHETSVLARVGEPASSNAPVQHHTSAADFDTVPIPDDPVSVSHEAVRHASNAPGRAGGNGAEAATGPEVAMPTEAEKNSASPDIAAETEEQSLLRAYSWESGSQGSELVAPRARTSRWRFWAPKR